MDTGDLNGLKSFSMHRVTWMTGKTMHSILGGCNVIGEHREGEVIQL